MPSSGAASRVVHMLRSKATSSRSLRIIADASKGDREAEALEAELLSKLLAEKASGKSDDEIIASSIDLESDLEKLEALRDASGSPSSSPPLQELPPKGAEEWGRWSQDEDFISLELFVPEAVTAKDVLCEISVGFLDVRVKDEPLLSGRLAQQIIVSELNWALDDDPELSSRGQRLLCIELPKRERAIYGDNESFSEPLFQSLRVGEGEEVVGPGLVAGVYLD